jgi:hypothetical protein
VLHHDVLLVLWANHYERLRGFPQQAEGEFLVGLRASLLDLPLSKLDLAKDPTAAPRPTVETLGGLCLSCTRKPYSGVRRTGLGNFLCLAPRPQPLAPVLELTTDG